MFVRKHTVVTNITNIDSEPSTPSSRIRVVSKQNNTPIPRITAAHNSQQYAHIMSSTSTTSSPVSLSAAPPQHPTNQPPPPPPPTNAAAVATAAAAAGGQQPRFKTANRPSAKPPSAAAAAATSAAAALGREQIFHLLPVVRNFDAVHSAYVRSSRTGHHLLCLADGSDQLFLHETPEYGNKSNRPAASRQRTPPPTDAQQTAEIRHNVRSVSWFRDEGKRVQDMCFDASGSMLLVLCEYSVERTVQSKWAQRSFKIANTKIATNCPHYPWRQRRRCVPEMGD